MHLLKDTSLYLELLCNFECLFLQYFCWVEEEWGLCAGSGEVTLRLGSVTLFLTSIRPFLFLFLSLDTFHSSLVDLTSSSGFKFFSTTGMGVSSFHSLTPVLGGRGQFSLMCPFCPHLKHRRILLSTFNLSAMSSIVIVSVLLSKSFMVISSISSRFWPCQFLLGIYVALIIFIHSHIH